MTKFLFRSKMIRAAAVAGVMAMVPVMASTASADTTSVFATAQGTSVLGVPVPVLGTQGFTVTLPVNGQVVPQAVSDALDFTATADVQVGDVQVANVYVDPRMGY